MPSVLLDRAGQGMAGLDVFVIDIIEIAAEPSGDRVRVRLVTVIWSDSCPALGFSYAEAETDASDLELEHVSLTAVAIGAAEGAPGRSDGLDTMSRAW